MSSGLCDEIRKEFVLQVVGSEGARKDSELTELLKKNIKNVKANVNKALPSHPSGNTMLHCAVARGRRRTVTWLLANTKANPNATNRWGETPLHMSSTAYVKSIVLKLAEAGADMNKPSSLGESPQQLAERKGVKKLTALLSQYNGAGASKSKDAKQIAADAEEGQKVVKHLSKYFRGIQKPKYQKKIIKMMGEHAELAQKGLLDVHSQRDKNTDTFLHLASRACAAGVVSMLLKLGVSPNVKNEVGATPLHLACEQFQADTPDAQQVIKSLLEGKADMSQGDFKSDKTPLDLLESKEKRDWVLDATAAPESAEQPEAAAGPAAAKPKKQKKPKKNRRARASTRADLQQPPQQRKEAATKAASAPAVIDVVVEEELPALKNPEQQVMDLANGDHFSLLQNLHTLEEAEKVLEEGPENPEPARPSVRRGVDDVLDFVFTDRDALGVSEVQDIMAELRGKRPTKRAVCEAVRSVQQSRYIEGKMAVIREDFVQVMQALEVHSSRKQMLSWESRLFDRSGDGWLTQSQARAIWEKSSTIKKKPKFDRFLGARERVDQEARKMGSKPTVMRQTSVHADEVSSLALFNLGTGAA